MKIAARRASGLSARGCVRHAGLGLAATLLAVAAPAVAQTLTAVDHAVPAGLEGSAKLIVHRMPGTTRAISTVSTLLFLPAGTPPAGGWRIVAWAHGSTTPGDRRCAPSLSDKFDGGMTRDGAPSGYGPFLAALVNAGYAVVAPDYEGLGAAADSANVGFNTASIARALIFGMRAARQVAPGLSDEYVAVGHSDGARALIDFERYARTAPDLHQRGTVALAPFTSVRALVETLEAKPRDVETVGLANFVVALVATGAEVQDPSFVKAAVMGRDLADLMPRLRTMCGIPAGAAVTGAVRSRTAARFDGYRPTWWQAPAMKRYLAANDPAEVRGLLIRRPMLIEVGSADAFVPVAPLARLVERQRAVGASIRLDVLPGGDHFSVIRDGVAPVLRFLRSSFDTVPTKGGKTR